MAEVRDLENQIRNLEKQLEDQKKEAARMRREMADENLRKLRAYEKEMESGLKAHDKETQKQYKKLLEEYERSVDAEVADRTLMMNEQYQKLVAQVKKTEKEWQEKNRQLQEAVEKLKTDTANKEKVSSAEAASYNYEAGLAYKEVDKKPHEKFFPKRMQSFLSAISDARELAKKGLNEAAVAIYISARSGLNRLGFDIDEKFDEWVRLYKVFKEREMALRQKHKGELREWFSFTEQPVPAGKLSTEEFDHASLSLNYWTEGVFSRVGDRLTKLEQEIAKVESRGPEEYLKQEESMDIDALKAATDELKTLDSDLDKSFVLYRQRYTAACERADWGEKIIDFLENELNLTWIESESNFKATEAEVSDSDGYRKYMTMQYGSDYEKVDTRQWLELTFVNSVGTTIFVYIVPYEKGEKVENRIVLYIDYSGAENEEYSRHIYRHICESINLQTDDGIINFATNVEQLSSNTNATLRETGKSIERKMGRMQK